MRLVQFVRKSSPHARLLGAELSDGGKIVDLTHIAPSTLDFVRGGENALSVARTYLETSPPAVTRAEIELAAPITGMDKVWGTYFINYLKKKCVFCKGSLYWYEL